MIFAPIGAALLGAGASTAATIVVGAAVVGAVTGGVVAAATGGNILEGMLIGGLAGAGGAAIGIGTGLVSTGAATGAGTGLTSAATLEANFGAGGALTTGTAGAEVAGTTVAGLASEVAPVAAAEGLTTGETLMATTGLSAVGGAAKSYQAGKAAEELQAARDKETERTRPKVAGNLGINTPTFTKSKTGAESVASTKANLAQRAEDFISSSMNAYRTNLGATTPTQQPPPQAPAQPGIINSAMRA